jgi:hypothetical protein
MGVHDFRCSVCSEPGSYTCGEKTGEECEQEGFGSDEAVLDLFFFAEEDTPASVEAFEQTRGRARRVETKTLGYDWGEWEFEPSLNYREVLMGAGDEVGVWELQPFREGGDGSPISIEIPGNERVWAVNYCVPCRAHFVDGTAAEEPCIEYLRTIAENLRLDFKGVRGSEDKPRFVEAVRAVTARRRPLPG